ncbi:MAG: hypothetical protein EAY81_08550 [Bacteroidetes bacterium]|nr:MAG: hypothetical protein EAY81_08550 [Bacteroidota bacterium]
MKQTACLIILSLLVLSCSHYDELKKNGKESEANSSESHNSGQNCMTCHNRGEFDEAVIEGGWWNIAGTAYNTNATTPASEGSIELWTGPGRTGEFVYKLPIDAKGNFYTAKVVDFKGGFYPVLLDKDGKVKKDMDSKTSTGACNSCHGVTETKIEF